MKSLKFAHISDTHLVSGNPSPLLESLYRRGRAPVDNFISCLRELSTQSLDFVIHTGDAVHEGDADGYAKFRSLLNNFLPGIPVLVALGNHDHPEAFCNSFLNQSGNAEHFYCEEMLACGLRILILDTGRSNRMGSLDAEQEAWLKERLAYSNPNGTFLMMHHPLVGSPGPLCLRLSDPLQELIRQSDIRAIFSGHSHSPFSGTYCGKPCFTAAALAFGVNYTQSAARYTTDIGYHLLTLNQNGNFTQRMQRVTAPENVVKEISLITSPLATDLDS